MAMRAPEGASMSRVGFTRRWRVVRITSPTAGANWTMTAPGGATWRVTSLVARLVTSAVVANRRVSLTADDGTSVWYAQTASADQTATQTTDYAAHTGGVFGGVTPGTLMVPLPTAGLLLRPGNRLVVATSAIDGGDQWSRIVAMVDEVPSDVPYVGDMGPVTTLDTGG